MKIKYRDVETAVGIIKCPKHINRIECKKRYINGWQLRFDRVSPQEPYYSKFFSDGNYSHNLLKSLEAATIHLEEVQRHYRETDQLVLPESENVHYGWRNHASNNSWEFICIVHICQYMNKRRTLKYYLGTINTVCQERLDCMEKHYLRILEWRREQIATIGREELMKIEIPPEIKNIDPRIGSISGESIFTIP